MSKTATVSELEAMALVVLGQGAVEKVGYSREPVVFAGSILGRDGTVILGPDDFDDAGKIKGIRLPTAVMNNLNVYDSGVSEDLKGTNKRYNFGGIGDGGNFTVTNGGNVEIHLTGFLASGGGLQVTARRINAIDCGYSLGEMHFTAADELLLGASQVTGNLEVVNGARGAVTFPILGGSVSNSGNPRFWALAPNASTVNCDIANVGSDSGNDSGNYFEFMLTAGAKTTAITLPNLKLTSGTSGAIINCGGATALTFGALSDPNFFRGGSSLAIYSEGLISASVSNALLAAIKACFILNTESNGNLVLPAAPTGQGIIDMEDLVENYALNVSGF
jgi:hypothetical protein